MGLIIERKSLSNMKLSQLIIYGFKPSNEAISMNKAIAEELLSFEPKDRTFNLEKCFLKALDKYLDVVLIKDIDVLFNPLYKIDVLNFLITANKKRSFSLIWPGKIESNKLIYSEEGLLDFRFYDIYNYDVICVI